MSAWMSRATAFALVLMLAGCDLYETPERFVDDTAQPPVFAPFPISDLKDGQAVAGTLRLMLGGLPAEGPVDYYVVYVNGVEYAQVHDAPYVFNLHTSFFPDGPAVLAVGAVLRDPNNGLLNLAERLPSYIFEKAIVFDQSPPTPVATRTAAWNEDGTVTVSWSRNRDANFHAYIITRPGNPEEPGFLYDRRQVLVDSIFDPSVTSLRDDHVPTVYGAGTTYYVTVSNRADVPEDRDGVYIEYGERLNVEGDPYSVNFFYGPDKTRAYLFEDNGLTTYATATGKRLSSVSLDLYYADAGLSDVQELGLVGLTPDGSELFVYATEYQYPELRTFVFALSMNDDVPQFSRSLTALPEQAYRLRVGPRGRLVGMLNQDLHAFDAADGRDVGLIARDAPSLDVGIATSDGGFVMAELSWPGPVELRSYDLTQPGFPLRGSIDVPQHDDGGATFIRASSDGRFVYVAQSTRNRLVVYDAATLEPVADGSLSVLNADREIADLVEIGGRLYATIYVRRAGEPRGLLAEIDPATLDVQRTWPFSRNVRHMLPQAGDASVLVFPEYPEFGITTAWPISLR